MFLSFLLLTGSTYIHWGKSSCTSNGTLVYSGELVVLHLFLNVLILCTELRQINPFHDVHFCKPLLSGYPFYRLSRLQNVQSSAVKLVSRVHKGNREHSHIQALCWLLVKTALFQIADRRIRRILPHIETKTLGQRSFCYCAPKEWNYLPSDFRHIQFPYEFKTSPITIIHM